jgi:hypothetical protein
MDEPLKLNERTWRAVLRRVGWWVVVACAGCIAFARNDWPPCGNDEVSEARSPSGDFAVTPTAQPTISSRSSRPRSKSDRACVFRQLKL